MRRGTRPRSTPRRSTDNAAPERQSRDEALRRVRRRPPSARGQPAVSENTLANRTVHVVPRADDLNDRVDRCLAAHIPALTRSQAGRLAQEGAVRLG
ncbi:MAG: hypothetical protein GW802_29645, partial [Armatimonadetes bacterium]|nr:hypothetical protein [Armatimonadota bacterium]